MADAVEIAGPAQSAQMPELSWGDIRDVTNAFAANQGEWAGSPIPINHLHLILEPRYPFQRLHGACLDKPSKESDEDTGGAVLVNSWRSKCGDVVLWREADGRLCHVLLPQNREMDRLRLALNTLAPCGVAWDLEQELTAQQKLMEHLSGHAFRCYLLTGMFLETSKRSMVTYLFRRLRPTLAMRPGPNNNMRVLTALCMHPIGYYDQSFAGTMVPTDDVIAHLLMMRGNEHLFWRKANHHAIELAQAGI